MKNATKLVPLLIVVVMLFLCVSGCAAQESADKRTEQEKLYDSLDAELIDENGKYNSCWLDEIYNCYRYLQLYEDINQVASEMLERESEKPYAKGYVNTYDEMKKRAQNCVEEAKDALTDLIDSLENQKLVGEYYSDTILALMKVRSELNYSLTGSTTIDLMGYLRKAGYEFPIHTGVLD